MYARKITPSFHLGRKISGASVRAWTLFVPVLKSLNGVAYRFNPIDTFRQILYQLQKSAGLLNQRQQADYDMARILVIFQLPSVS